MYPASEHPPQQCQADAVSHLANTPHTVLFEASCVCSEPFHLVSSLHDVLLSFGWQAFIWALAVFANAQRDYDLAGLESRTPPRDGFKK